MSLTPVPFNPRIRIVDPSSGYLTSQGYRFLQAMRVSLIGLEEIAADDTLASGLLSFEANATPGGGATAQIDAMTRTVAGGVSSEAGLTIRSFVAGMTTSSQILLKADSLYFWNGTTQTKPFVIVGTTTYLQDVVVDGNLLVTGTVTTGKVAYGAVGSYASGSGSATSFSGWTTVATASINNESGLMPLIHLTYGLTARFAGGPDGAVIITSRVVRTDNTGNVLHAIAAGATNAAQTGNAYYAGTVVDTAPASGVRTYAIQVEVTTSGNAAVGTGTAANGRIDVVFNKR